MSASRTDGSPAARGRILAVIYLAVVACGIVGQAVIADSMVAGSDALKTAANITGDPARYRVAYTLFMVEMVAQIAVSAIFYDLLKPVNRSLARLAAIIGIAGSGIKAFARLFYYAPLILLGGSQAFAAIEPAQLAAMSLASIRINNQGAAIALVFFGVEAVMRGWLVYRSEFLPRFLGVISMIGGIGWLTYLWPPLGNAAFMFVALVGLLGVVLTTGWLLVRGVDEPRWRQRAELAAASIWR